MTIATLYPPMLAQQLAEAGDKAIAHRTVCYAKSGMLAGIQAVHSDAIAEIDRITDQLAELGLCRQRDDASRFSELRKGCLQRAEVSQ